MKPPSIQPRSIGLLAALIACTCPMMSRATVTVDGIRNTGSETEYVQLAVQSYTAAWGANNALANLHNAQSGKLLNLFIAGRADGNAIILFIDSKSGGVSTLTRDLIRSGGEEDNLNHLAPDSGTGMTFESGFQPDYAIRIYGSGTEAYASAFDLQKRIRIDLGRVDNTTASHGPVTALRTSWADVGADSSTYSSAVNGVEMALNMALLGVPEGSQNVKVMAILVNGDSTYGSNQTLASLGADAVMAGGVRGFNFETETGTQTLMIAVNRPALVAGDDEDGDGISNSTDPLPLDPTRNITFSVNMNVEHAKGYFAPPSAVHVKFFTGSQTPNSTLELTDPDGDLVYTGVLTNVTGFAGDSFGTYKFTTDDLNNTNGGYEFGYDRGDTYLGAANSSQILPSVFFSNDATLSFSTWAAANAGNQAADLDYDGDGVPNGVEYFMGATGSSFTTNPPLVNHSVSWPHSPYATGVTYRLRTSDDLVNWPTDVTADADIISDPAFVKYTFPMTAPKKFVRLEVTVP